MRATASVPVFARRLEARRCCERRLDRARRVAEAEVADERRVELLDRDGLRRGDRAVERVLRRPAGRRPVRGAGSDDFATGTRDERRCDGAERPPRSRR